MTTEQDGLLSEAGFKPAFTPEKPALTPDQPEAQPNEAELAQNQKLAAEIEQSWQEVINPALQRLEGASHDVQVRLRAYTQAYEFFTEQVAKSVSHGALQLAAADVQNEGKRVKAALEGLATQGVKPVAEASGQEAQGLGLVARYIGKNPKGSEARTQVHAEFAQRINALEDLLSATKTATSTEFQQTIYTATFNIQRWLQDSRYPRPQVPAEVIQTEDNLLRRIGDTAKALQRTAS